MADATEALSVKVGTASVDVKSSATAEVKFETDGASGADASAAEAEFKKEANAEVTIKVAKATVMEANFTAVGANSVSICK